MKMADLQTAITMIFISIMDDNVTFTKVVVLVVSKKRVRKGINLSLNLPNKRQTRRKVILKTMNLQ